ncbi:hypothetical protein VH569_03315 [Azospirillum sp. 11R-A]|uniref:hypothetical protein n=1 Tax=Azospirillum sp. 11R-A TaxID=3111634 RepID=UPI003C136A00
MDDQGTHESLIADHERASRRLQARLALVQGHSHATGCDLEEAVDEVMLPAEAYCFRPALRSAKAMEAQREA